MEEKKLSKKEQAVKDELQNRSEEEDMKLVHKCRVLETQAVEARRKVDWEWLVRTLYVRGYHFARYNRGTNTVVFSTRTGVKIPINLVNAHLRGVRNQVTSFQPKWEVLPNVTTESAMENARYSGKVLDYIYEKSQVKRKIKEAVNDCLIYSLGIWQFSSDAKKNISIVRVDPFDFLVDPNIKSPDLSDPEYGAEFVIKTVQVPTEYVRNNKKFQHTENLQSDNKPAAALYKQFLLQMTRQMYESKKENNETTILKEAILRERDENNNIKLRIVHYVDGIDKPLRNQLIDTDQYPYETLQGDITPGELYGESWVKHLIPINRVIDALEAHIFEYNHFFARGRYVVDKNSGVRLIVNQHGQIIEKNRGSEVTSLPISPLPPSPQQQIASMRQYLEDISGVHDVSLGRLPGTIRSGTAIAELRQSDATNQSDLVDNLQDFLSRAGRKILRLVAENWTTTKLITVTGMGGRPEYFMAVGEKGSIDKKTKKFTFGEMKLPIAIIGADNEVRVQVGSWLAYTKEARQEKLKELFRLGAIDQQTYLEFAEFADIDGIVKRTRDESLLQSRRSRPSTEIANKFGIEMDEESLAMAENELMLEGKDQPVYPSDDHEVHLTIHAQEQKSELVQAHMNEHITQQRWVMKNQSAPMMPPEGGEGGMPPGPPGAPGGQFRMNPVVGPGAPPFQSDLDLIRGGNGMGGF